MYITITWRDKAKAQAALAMLRRSGAHIATDTGIPRVWRIADGREREAVARYGDILRLSWNCPKVPPLPLSDAERARAARAAEGEALDLDEDFGIYEDFAW